MSKTKKLLVCITVSIMFIQFVIPMGSLAKIKNYLATGDSIAYGYGLSNIELQSYAQNVRKKLGVSSSNFKNLSVSGMTCQEKKKKIQTDEYKKEIKKADLMTISIGSNELLKIATEVISNVTGIPDNDPDFLTKVSQAFVDASLAKKYAMATSIYNFFNRKETKDKIDEGIQLYENYWQKSVDYIKSINPNINIIATEFYNPYYEVGVASYDIGSFVDEAIVKMNTILKNKSNNESNYKIAKIYQAFNTTNPRLTNVDINISLSNFRLELDPHPNEEGNKIIATKIMEAIEEVQYTIIKIPGKIISDIEQQVYTNNTFTQSIIKENASVKLAKKDNEKFLVL